jgi:hypothetical protein
MRYHIRRLLARGDKPLVDGRILCTSIGERVTPAEARLVARRKVSVGERAFRESLALVYRLKGRST